MANTMNDEEIQARAEALRDGQLEIIEMTLAVLLVSSRDPGAIAQEIADQLTLMKNTRPTEYEPDWRPSQKYSGAEKTARNILHLHRATAHTRE